MTMFWGGVLLVSRSFLVTPCLSGLLPATHQGSLEPPISHISGGLSSPQRSGRRVSGAFRPVVKVE